MNFYSAILSDVLVPFLWFAAFGIWLHIEFLKPLQERLRTIEGKLDILADQVRDAKLK